MHWLFLIFLLPYIVILLRINRYLGSIKPFIPAGTPGISISVIVACRNEAGKIGHLLEDLSEQVFPSDLFEVIIIDDNSEDGTSDIVSRFEGIKNLRLMRNSGNGKKMAIATGVRAATGELIVTTDADCRTGKKWLTTHASFYNIYKPGLIIAPVVLDEKPGFFGRFQELEYLSLQGITAGTVAAGRSTMCNGANMAFERELFLKHQGSLHYELTSGDDIFLLHSIKKEKGKKIMWLESSDATVRTAPSANASTFLSQRRRWISKAKAYNDSDTIVLAIVTFVTILIEMSLFAGSLVSTGFLPLFFSAFLLKSFPDFLILCNTTTRYGKKGLMRWFVPTQLLYPFYVSAVAFFSLSGDRSGKISYPSQKGT